MKKTMFITSVIMVVVLAIALTTSSLAWFQAGGNQTVAVNQINVAATSEASAAGLLIATATPGQGNTWTTGDFTNAPISLSNVSGLSPACPVGLLSGENQPDYSITVSESSFAVSDQNKLYNSLISQMRANKVYLDYTDMDTSVEPAQPKSKFQGNITSTSASVQYFAVANSGETAIENLAAANHFKITISLYKNANGVVIDSEHPVTGWEADVWGMLFDITDPSNAKLVAYANNRAASTFSYAATEGMLATGELTSLVDNTFVPSKFGTLPATTFAAGSLNTTTGVIDHGAAHYYALVIWFDGNELTKGSSGTEAKVSVQISTQSLD